MGGAASFAISLVLVTFVGAGTGYVASLYLAAPAAVAADEAAAPAEPKPAAAEDAASPEGAVVTALPPILTNLAHPEGTWVRAEMSLLSDAPLPAGDAERVAQALLAFLRTVRLDQVEGPSGFLTLREELDGRAVLRTEGRARRVLMRTLLFE